jgi:hypothetical protein
MTIRIDIDKAKQVAHEWRREARADEFAPYDEIIMKQIPGADQQEAEAARQEIRNRYAALQVQIDGAQTVEELKALLPEVAK